MAELDHPMPVLKKSKMTESDDPPVPPLKPGNVEGRSR